MLSRLSPVQNKLAYHKYRKANVLSTSITRLALTNDLLNKQLVTQVAKPNIELPKSTKVIICGGGLIGTSIAYHLTQLGYKDIILLTRNKY
jgi:hypothetical protein